LLGLYFDVLAFCTDLNKTKAEMTKAFFICNLLLVLPLLAFKLSSPPVWLLSDAKLYTGNSSCRVFQPRRLRACGRSVISPPFVSGTFFYFPLWCKNYLGVGFREAFYEGKWLLSLAVFIFLMLFVSASPIGKMNGPGRDHLEPA